MSRPTPLSRLRVVGTVLVLAACPGLPPSDAGIDDAGSHADAGRTDAGPTDAGADAGSVMPDGGVDGGAGDAGAFDAGPERRRDAGWPTGRQCSSNAPPPATVIGPDSLFGSPWPVSHRLVALARSQAWRGAAWSAFDGGPGVLLRAEALDGGAVVTTWLPTLDEPERLDVAFEADRLVAAWATRQRVQAAVWAPTSSAPPTSLELRVGPFGHDVDVALVAQADGGVSALWRSDGPDGGAVLERQRVVAAAPKVSLALSSEPGVRPLHVAATADGFVLAWERGAAWLGPDFEWRDAVTTLPGTGGARVAYNPRTGAVALARISGGRRPLVTVDELQADGGLRPLFQHQDGAYSTTPLRSSLALAACGQGFVVVFRDDATHRRGFPACNDEEYCLTNDLRAVGVTGPDAGVQEWFLTAHGPRQTERALSPALLPSSTGAALDVAWISQPVDDVQRAPGLLSVVLAPGAVDCSCAAP